MAQDVEHLAGRVANKEAADAPRLVGQGMHDLAPQALSRSVRRVDIVDLNRRIWHHSGGRVFPHHADLRRRVPGRGEGHDPPKIHDRLKPKHLGVERTAACWVVGLKIGHHAPDAHSQRMTDATTARGRVPSSPGGGDRPHGKDLRTPATATNALVAASIGGHLRWSTAAEVISLSRMQPFTHRLAVALECAGRGEFPKADGTIDV